MKKVIYSLMFLLPVIFVNFGCKKDDPLPEPEPEPEPEPSATILPFQQKTQAAANDELIWTAQAWYDWVMNSGLTGMASSFAKHSLLQGQKSGTAVLQIAPRHEVLAQQAYETVKKRLLQDFAQLELQLALVEPMAQTPLQLEEQRLLAIRQQAQVEFLADPMVQHLMQTFNAQLIVDSLIVGDKK